MHTNSSKLKLNLAIFACVIAAMLFCANSSPFINIITTDSSAFRVMGRAMAAGKVMYKDIFDHKGLYLYVINALGVLISSKSFFGLFVIECVFMFLCARIAYSILSNYADSKTSFIGTQIFMALSLMRNVFGNGNLSEGYGLLFQVLAVYMLIKDGGKFSCLHMFFQGICAGTVIFFRPNIAMMWGGIALVAGYEMLRQKRFARLAGNIAAWISGVIVAAAPAVIYAVMTDSVSDMIFGMFGYNMMYLSSGEMGKFSPFTLIWRILALVNPPGSILSLLELNFFLAVLIFSCALMLKKYRNFPFIKYYFAMMIITLVSVALSGRSYGHYYEMLSPFCLPFAYWAASKVKPEKYKSAAILLTIITVMMGTIIPNSIREYFGKQNITVDEFVKCNEPYYSENERVLVTVHGAMFYEAFGVIPQEKYFYTPSNEYSAFPEAVDSHVASILSGVNDVIIVITLGGEKGIYPETGKSTEIQEFLDSYYDLLHYEEDGKRSAAMYGKKRK